MPPQPAARFLRRVCVPARCLLLEDVLNHRFQLDVGSLDLRVPLAALEHAEQLRFGTLVAPVRDRNLLERRRGFLLIAWQEKHLDLAKSSPDWVGTGDAGELELQDSGGTP